MQKMKWDNELIQRLSLACGKSPEYIKRTVRDLIKELKIEIKT